jgi:hypothetical protein
MWIFLRLGLAFLLIAAPAGFAAAAPHRDSKAEAVLARSKAASGGAAWDRFEGWYEEGLHNDQPYRVWLDQRAWGRRVEARVGTVEMIMGYDGRTAWRKVGDALTTMTDAASLSEARISAFVSNNGYYYRDRFPATASYARRARDGKSQYDVIEMQPEGARAVRLWFDGKTHLLARIEDVTGEPPVTVHISDYRRVEGVLIAFAGYITDAAGTVLDRGTVTSVVHRPVSRSLFEPQSGE